MREHVKANETKKIAKYAGKGSTAEEISRHMGIDLGRVKQFMPAAMAKQRKKMAPIRQKKQAAERSARDALKRGELTDHDALLAPVPAEIAVAEAPEAAASGDGF